MSIYYNVSVNANRDTDTLASIVDTENNEFVVDKQDEYQVGVARFKIPLGLVDMYRIYSEEFNLSVNIPTVLTSASNVNTSQFSDLASTIMGRPTNISHDQIVTNTFPIGLDAQKAQSPFVSIQDDYHYCKWLNKGLMTSFSNNLEKINPVPTGRITVHNPTINTGDFFGNNSVGIATDLTKNSGYDILGSIAIAVDNIAGGQNTGQNTQSIVAGLKLTIKNIRKPTTANAMTRFSNIQFGITKYATGQGSPLSNSNNYVKGGGGTAPEPNLGSFSYGVWWFNDDILEDALAQTTYDASSADQNLVFTTKDFSQMFASNNKSADNYNAYRALHPTDEYVMFPDGSDFSSLIGSRADGYTWYLIMRQKSNPAQTTGGTAGAYISTVTTTTGVNITNATDIVLNMTTVQVYMDKPTLNPIANVGDMFAKDLGAAPNLATTAVADITSTLNKTEERNTDWGNVNTWLVPQFRFDESLKKMFLYQGNGWGKMSGYSLFMNNSLFNSLGFQGYSNMLINAQNRDRVFATTVLSSTTINKDQFLNGFILKFKDNGILQNLNALMPDATNFQDWLCYYERENSQFARNFLNGLVVTSSSIATQGEITGNGQSVKKVITDFKIDPSQVQRDYILYEPSGGIRYYPLISPQPLHTVAVEIFFEDINGIQRILPIPNSQSMSIKLEFRPNNMIYNY